MIFPSFRQSEPSHYNGENHRTRNRLVYPEMTAQVRSALRTESRQLWINANVSGFILDLDSTIAGYIFSLINVYRQGKERLDQLSNSIARTPPLEPEETEISTLKRHYQAIPTSSVFTTLTFLSGKVHMYSSAATKMYLEMTPSGHAIELSDEQILELGAEVFNLPVVSLWGEYRATPAVQKCGGSHDEESSTLMFKSTVHSSRNVLRPTLLPFLTELFNHIEGRIHKNNGARVMQYPIMAQSNSFVSIDKEETTLNVVSSMRISFSLRIDRSKLEFTCQPDVNVVTALRWESGGFIINASPGARQVSFSGTVGGLSIGLKHGFLSEDCLRLDARNLTFSVCFSRVESVPRQIMNFISVILDTEFHGRVKFSRLQDILCFKAVWLDLFPLFHSQSPLDPKAPSKPTPNSSFSTLPTKHSLSTVLLLRVREINFEVDLGSSISRTTLQLNQAVLRTNLMERLNDVAIHVEELLIIADGNLSGQARVCDCLFRTTKRAYDRSLEEVDGRMLELRLTSGPVIITLESDRQRLLHYQ